MARLSQAARMLHVPAPNGQISISVSRAGADPDRHKPRLLLVHGNPADMDDWAELVRHLGQSAELVALDLPGFGMSDAVSESGARLLDVFADCVAATARRLGWQTPYYIVGHSHGAGVAQTVAARHPDSVAGLILLSSLGVPAHASYRQLALPGVHRVLRLVGASMKSRAGRQVMRAALDLILAPMFHPAAVPAGGIEEQLRRFTDRPESLVNMALLARGNPSDQLARDAARIRAPALFVHGKDDRIVPASHAAAISSLIARNAPTSLELLPRAGHMLHRTHAAEVGRLLLRWLAILPRSSAHELTGQVPRS